MFQEHKSPLHSWLPSAKVLTSTEPAREQAALTSSLATLAMTLHQCCLKAGPATSLRGTRPPLGPRRDSHPPGCWGSRLGCSTLSHAVDLHAEYSCPIPSSGWLDSDRPLKQCLATTRAKPRQGAQKGVPIREKEEVVSPSLSFRNLKSSGRKPRQTTAWFLSVRFYRDKALPL